MEYLVRKRDATAELDWGVIANFHPTSSEHRPVTRFVVEHDAGGIHVSFRASDRYVICRRTRRQEMVCRDSCVEAFLQPRADRGYFNFEVNCGGTMLLYYVTDATRTPTGGIKAAEPVADALLDLIRVEHSMPKLIEREIQTPVEWRVSYHVPYELFERYVGDLDRTWRGNFYKCADESSHPHWASWKPIGAALNFHAPEHFGRIRFE